MLINHQEVKLLYNLSAVNNVILINKLRMQLHFIDDLIANTLYCYFVLI